MAQRDQNSWIEWERSQPIEETRRGLHHFAVSNNTVFPCTEGASLCPNHCFPADATYTRRSFTLDTHAGMSSAVSRDAERPQTSTVAVNPLPRAYGELLGRRCNT